MCQFCDQITDQLPQDAEVAHRIAAGFVADYAGDEVAPVGWDVQTVQDSDGSGQWFWGVVVWVPPVMDECACGAGLMPELNHGVPAQLLGGSGWRVESPVCPGCGVQLSRRLMRTMTGGLVEACALESTWEAARELWQVWHGAREQLAVHRRRLRLVRATWSAAHHVAATMPASRTPKPLMAQSSDCQPVG